MTKVTWGTFDDWFSLLHALVSLAGITRFHRVVDILGDARSEDTGSGSKRAWIMLDFSCLRVGGIMMRSPVKTKPSSVV